MVFCLLFRHLFHHHHLNIHTPLVVGTSSIRKMQSRDKIELLQVAQGLLDHMHSVVDPTQWHQRRELGDMLLLHSIQPQAAQAAQKHSKGTIY